MRIARIFALISSIITISAGLTQGQIEPGNYSGIMQLKPRTIGLDSIGVELQITKTNDTLFEWTMRYTNSLEKNYRLIVKDGQYLLDEQNGIFLPGSFEDQKLNFHYEVDSVLYEVVYDFSLAGSIGFDLRYFRRNEPAQIDNNHVQGYFLSGRQYALLKKKV